MKKGLVAIVVVLVAVVVAAVWWVRRDGRDLYFTGFVEGEERVIRSEVVGRVLEVPFAEGAAVPPNAVVARLDESDIAAKITAKQRELEKSLFDARMKRVTGQLANVASIWGMRKDLARVKMLQDVKAKGKAEAAPQKGTR